MVKQIMRQNYSHEPELPGGEWLRYIVFACIIQVLLMLFVIVRLVQIMAEDLDWLREAVPPVADLIVLAALVVFCMKTLTIWRKTETHPRRRQMRILMVSLLGQAWLYFIIGSYAEPFTRWALLTSS